MRDFIREYGRIGGFVAASAFILSLLIGLLSRNTFLTVLFRGLAISVVFGVLGCGVRYISTKFLLDLRAGADGGQATAEEAGARPPEGRINIVLPEENPLLMPASGENPEQAEDAGVEMGGAARREEPRGVRRRGASPTEEAPAGETEIAELFGAEDGEEASQQAGAPKGPSGVESGAEAREEPLPDIERLASSKPGVSGGSPAGVDEGRPAGRRRARPAADSEGAGSFPSASVARMGSGAATRSGGRERPGEALKARVSGEDPQDLAKAIRTVLKRDERG